MAEGSVGVCYLGRCGGGWDTTQSVGTLPVTGDEEGECEMNAQSCHSNGFWKDLSGPLYFFPYVFTI